MRPYMYLRPGLLRGLELEQSLGANPFKFGFVGSTDVHNTLTAVEEDNFFGKIVIQEPSADPVSKEGFLDRVQIVKGWVDKDGTAHERIADVVWGDADRRTRGANGEVPPVGDTVDVARATWSDSIGDPELTSVWTDPAFDPTVRAFYYARVIEIPTPRWTASHVPA